MMRRLRLSILIIMIFSMETAAHANVSWDFIVTSSVNSLCPGCPPQFPLPAFGGSLIMSDAAFFRGGLSYFYEADRHTDTIVAVGDTDFSLSLGTFDLPLDPGLLSLPGITDLLSIGGVGLGASSAGKLSGHISINTFIDNIEMDISDSIVTGANWASDNAVPGCDTFTQCEIDGYWQLTSPLPVRVPEPSGVSILLLWGTIAVLGLCGRHTTRT